MLFSDPFREFDILTGDLFGARARAVSLHLDAWLDDNALHLELEAPGVTQENISLEVDQNVLTVKVDRPFKEIAGKSLVNERSYGTFERSIRLSDTLDTEAVNASLENGILSITIPVTEKAKPRRIEIKQTSDDVKEISSTA